MLTGAKPALEHVSEQRLDDGLPAQAVVVVQAVRFFGNRHVGFSGGVGVGAGEDQSTLAARSRQVNSIEIGAKCIELLLRGLTPPPAQAGFSRSAKCLRNLATFGEMTARQ